MFAKTFLAALIASAATAVSLQTASTTAELSLEELKDAVCSWYFGATKTNAAMDDLCGDEIYGAEPGRPWSPDY